MCVDELPSLPVTMNHRKKYITHRGRWFALGHLRPTLIQSKTLQTLSLFVTMDRGGISRKKVLTIVSEEILIAQLLIQSSIQPGHLIWPAPESIHSRGPAHGTRVDDSFWVRLNRFFKGKFRTKLHLKNCIFQYEWTFTFSISDIKGDLLYRVWVYVPLLSPSLSFKFPYWVL